MLFRSTATDSENVIAEVVRLSKEKNVDIVELLKDYVMVEVISV